MNKWLTIGVEMSLEHGAVPETKALLKKPSKVRQRDTGQKKELPTSKAGTS